MTGPPLFKYFFGDVVTFSAGSVLFKEGDPGDYLYVIRTGEVEALLDGKSLEIVGENGIVGEMALLDDSPRSATVIARTDVEAVAVDTDIFLRYIHQMPMFALEVMRVMNRRLRNVLQSGSS